MPQNNRYYLLAGQPEFAPATGKFAGKTFRRGKDYTEIPQGYEVRFGSRGSNKKAAEALLQEQTTGKKPGRRTSTKRVADAK